MEKKKARTICDHYKVADIKDGTFSQNVTSLKETLKASLRFP